MLGDATGQECGRQPEQDTNRRSKVQGAGADTTEAGTVQSAVIADGAGAGTVVSRLAIRLVQDLQRASDVIMDLSGSQSNYVPWPNLEWQ